MVHDRPQAKNVCEIYYNVCQIIYCSPQQIQEVEIDRHIGRRLQQARTLAHLSQTELGKSATLAHADPHRVHRSRFLVMDLRWAAFSKPTKPGWTYVRFSLSLSRHSKH